MTNLKIACVFARSASLTTSLAACGTDDEADRGGPDALTGFTWQTKLKQGELDFLFGFTFTDTDVTASNVCTLGNDTLTAKVTTPVKYRYSAVVPTGGRAGDDACFVDVAKATFDFELQGSKLIMTVGAQRVEFDQAGARSGLYGEWTGSANGFKLVWSMGGGKIRARSECPGGKTASVTVDATFQNFVDILAAKSEQVGDDTFSCSVGVDKAMATYRFAGEQLILTVQGEDTTFDPK